MIIYNYDGDTGLYYTSSTAKANPRVEGAFLIPSNATVLEPTPGAGQVSVFSGGAWTYTADLTLVTYYSIVDGSTVVNTDPLNVPADTTELVPPSFDPVTETRSWDGSAWVVEAIPAPPAPGPDYVDFWNGLIQTAYYGKVKSASGITLTTNATATEFIALFGDAKSGRNMSPVAIQASFDELLAAVSADATDQSDLNGLLASSNLDSLYTLNF